MADTQTHSRLRGRIKRELNKMPGVMLTNGDASDGALDLILNVDGHYAELDVKTGDAVLSPAQQARRLQVERAGGKAYVVKSVPEAQQCIRHLRACR
ncbi:MAG: hypothetical protein OXQ29_15870 [Rhodospirillaceae bacterium]|nr:hypothetical protein [Rhodospirillaceae bacterium]